MKRRIRAAAGPASFRTPAQQLSAAQLQTRMAKLKLDEVLRALPVLPEIPGVVSYLSEEETSQLITALNILDDLDIAFARVLDRLA